MTSDAAAGPSLADIGHSVLGLAGLTLIAWLLSENRRAVRWRVAAAGLAIQIALCAAVLKLPPVRAVFAALGRGVDAIQEATNAGTALVFGYLGGGALPFAPSDPAAAYIIAFRALPLIIVFSALTALLTYWRILPWIVRGFSALLERSMGVGGAVGLSTAANIFLGMVEAPMMVRGYLAAMSRAELFVVMTAGMASLAGTMLAIYASFLAPVVPDAASHLIVASVLSAPASIMIAKLMIPDTVPPTPGRLAGLSGHRSAMDAIVSGTGDGLAIFLNVCAMLIVLTALVHLANAILGLLPAVLGTPLTLQRMLGWAMAPVVWLAGVPWREAATAGALMGTKTVLNEFVAYLDLARLPPEALSPRSRLIMTYALSGFANLASVGIMVAGLAGMAPERRGEIVGLGMRSVVSGTLATLLMAATIGLF